MVNLQDSGVYKDAVRFWQKKLESCKFWKIKHAKFPQTKEKQTNNYIYISYIYIRKGDNYNCDSILHDKNYAKRK